MRRRAAFLPISLLAAALLVVAGAGPASAAPSDGYATWAVAGTTGAYTGTVALPAGFPATTVTSTSRAFGTSSGNSSWLPTSSPAGQLVGSSQGKPYVSINPTSTTVPSTTTFRFATPTPVGVWGAAFGDIDAESLTISATDATGAPVAAADLGITSFNYCDATPNSCSAQATPLTLPTLTSTANSVTAEDPLCPTVGANCNTQGGSIWIAPLVSLSTLTITSTYKAGSPAAQMWFASVARTVAGVITLGTLPPVVVQLIEADGEVVASTTTAADGSFTLPPVIPSATYELRVDPAVAPNAPTVPIDVSVGDSVAVAFDVVPFLAAPTPAPSPTAVPGPNPVPAPAVPAAAAPAPAELADTGTDPAPSLAVAVALLAAGTAAILAATLVGTVQPPRRGRRES
ncbi:hypothetical protein [Conyzicola sp.]|uniref:hypothetical protein n=1 Tax=Conyzicola sp. TaxID=1969404 RepID=UPI0039890FA4